MLVLKVEDFWILLSANELNEPKEHIKTTAKVDEINRLVIM